MYAEFSLYHPRLPDGRCISFADKKKEKTAQDREPPIRINSGLLPTSGSKGHDPSPEKKGASEWQHPMHPRKEH